MIRLFTTKYWVFVFITLFAVSACNLSSSPVAQIDVTDVPTNFIPPTRTPLMTSGVPTTVNVTPLPLPTQSQFVTGVAIVQTAIPTNTALPVSIFILSPIPGNVVSGNVQVVGSATHPDFLLYRLEYASDPNPGNIWLPLTGDVQSPVIDGLLGIWNTTTVQDGSYQLRLRVFLRNGAEYGNVIVNNIRVQNTAPTPVPTNTPVIPRPIAAFTQDRLNGNAPLVVRFSNQSQGEISSYTWDFGDGSSSSELHPVHTFNTAGTYPVVLTVSGPGGVSNVSRQINVTTPDAPVASFTQDKISGPPPLEVTFSSLSTGQINNYAWDFGDGETGTGETITHLFETEGNYNVILRVTGPGGTSTATRQITVENPQIPAPEAAFTQSITSGDIPLQVQFISQSTGEITGYSWNFGDGTLGSSDQNPVHIFAQPGTYNVRLTVVGPGGQSEAEVTIEAKRPIDAPVASFTIEGSSTGEVPFKAQFNNTSTGEIDTYLWEFGDGGQNNVGGPVSHTYINPGTYTVRLTVSNIAGESKAEDTITVLRPPTPPEALFSANPESGNIPLVVTFTNQSTGEITDYSWDFGDGGSSTDLHPVHTFNTAGTYPVVLTVSGPGGTSNVSQPINVTAPDAPVASFTQDKISGPPPLEVTFSSLSTGQIDEYAWDFGDGETGTGETITHLFKTEGDYNVILRVTGPGGTSTATHPTTVEDPQILAPKAAFTQSVTTGDIPLQVQFNNTSTGEITDYSWDFGDGTLGSSDQNPVHTFAQPGTYNVRLTVVGPGGQSEAEVTIEAKRPIDVPVASFTIEGSSTGEAPFKAQFNNTSTGEITDYSWDFGDGGSSTDLHPVHTFNTAGTYPVVLTVSGPGGTSNVSQPINVTAPDAPVASFTQDKISGPPPLEVTFSSLSTGQIDEYAWDFGDGETGTGETITHLFKTEGDYNVILRVTGPGGQSEAEVTIEAKRPIDAPVASFTIEGSSTGEAPFKAQFNNTSTGEITDYSWDFGDGGSSTDLHPVHTFNTAGTYPVVLTVSGPGGTSNVSQPINVTAPDAPVASFTQDKISGPPPLEVTFSSLSTGQIDEYAWDFGDGETGTGETITHLFKTEGDYNVILRVTGPGGQSEAEVTIEAKRPIDAPVASFTIEGSSTGEVPFKAQFNNTSTGEIDAYLWEFGDGGQNNVGGLVSHTYTTPGTYTVRLTVSNIAGESKAEDTITVDPQLVPPQALFTANPESGQASLAVTFNNQSTGDNLTFEWDFGDGGSSTELHPVHTFNIAGTYPVQLTARNVDRGLSDEHVVNIVVQSSNLTASFTFEASPNDPLTINVVAEAKGGTGSYSYNWDFGDGNGVVASGETASVTYNEAGPYTITLTITDEGTTQTFTVTKDVAINEQPTSQTEETSASPNIEPIAPQLDSVYQAGVGAARDGNVFAVIGDQTANSANFLDPFGAPGYVIDPGLSSLQTLIDRYSTDLAVGGNSFTRNSIAAEDGLNVAEAIHDPATDPNCQAGESRVVCEIRLTNASIAIISMGYQDILDGTDPAQFEADINTLLQELIAANVLPIVSTTYPVVDPNLEQQALQINDAIINAATANEAPLFNQWRAFTDLPGGGLDSNGSPTVSGQGAGYLAANVTEGVNVRNLYILGILNAVLAEVNN